MLRTIFRINHHSTTANKASLRLYSFAAIAQAKAHGQGQGHGQTRRIFIKDLCVDADEDGMRLDRFLRHRLAQDPELAAINNTVVAKWLRKRQVKLIAKLPLTTTTIDKDASEATTKTITTGTTRTETGQTWRIRAVVDGATASIASGKESVSTFSQTNKKCRSIKPMDLLPLKEWVVYKDERIIVLNKPSGVPVQGGTGVTSSIDSSLSVLQGDYSEKPRLVHRLDRTTSGLLAVARTRKAAQDLAARFHEGTTQNKYVGLESNSRIQKKYLAIVESGKPIKEIYSNGATIRDDGSFRLQGDMSLITNEKAQAIQMVPNDTVSDPLVTKSVWPSTTDVVIAAQSYHSGVYWTLLHLYPRTGRKHQLRVHCAQLLNAPILGDFKYAGAGTRADTKGAPRIYLHMAELELKGWFTTSELQGTRIQEGANHRIVKDGTLRVTARPEDDMQRKIKSLGLI